MSEYHDEFRTVEGAGNQTIDVNSKSMVGSRFVDPSRLGSREEWKPSDTPGKMGKVVRIPNSLSDVARQAAGAMRTRSVFKDRGDTETRETNNYPMSCYEDGGGPLTRRRGDD